VLIVIFDQLRVENGFVCGASQIRQNCSLLGREFSVGVLFPQEVPITGRVFTVAQCITVDHRPQVLVRSPATKCYMIETKSPNKLRFGGFVSLESCHSFVDASLLT
jgi:hypothetical protein